MDTRHQRFVIGAITFWCVCGLILAFVVCAAPGDIPAEMITIGATPVGVTAALCGGPLGQYRTLIVILDQPVWATIHGPSAVPSSTMGMPMSPGQSVTVDHANEFKAVRQGASDARGYAVCIPR